jgi:hypothetical protein
MFVNENSEPVILEAPGLILAVCRLIQKVS